MLGDSRSSSPLDPPAISQETQTASEAFIDGRFGEALETSERLVSQKPCEAWSWRFRGECFLFLQRFEDAAHCFEKAISLGAGGTEDTFLWQALALHRSGDPEGARSVLESFLADEPIADTHCRGELMSKARTTLKSM